MPAPSANAKPLPKHLAQKSRDTADDALNETPKADQPFSDPNSHHVWSEFHTCRAIRNPAQTKADLSKPKQLWFYLGKTSTETKAHFTGDLKRPVNDPEANFLDSVRPPPPPYVPPPPVQRKSYPATYPSGVNIHAANAAGISKQYQQKPPPKPPVSKERLYNGKYAVPEPKPYQYKPKDTFSPNPEVYASLNKRPPSQTASSQSQPMYNNVPAYRAPPAPMAPMAPMTPAPSKPISPQYKKPVDYRRVRTFTSSPSFFPKADALQPSTQASSPVQPQPKPQNQLTQKIQAPVANMTANTAAPISSSSRPPSARPISSANQIAVTRDDKKGVSKLDIPANWHYLHQAEKERPKYYQSPYAPDGAITIACSPVNKALSNIASTNSSLSESFLMQRTPSQQEQVRGHIRRISDSRVKMQQEKIRQQQEELRRLTQQRERQQQQLRQERQALASANINPLSTSHLQNRHPSPIHPYNDFSSSYNYHSNPYASTLDTHAHSPTSYGSNSYQVSPTQHPNHGLPSPWSNHSPPALPVVCSTSPHKNSNSRCRGRRSSIRSGLLSSHSRTILVAFTRDCKRQQHSIQVRVLPVQAREEGRRAVL